MLHSCGSIWPSAPTVPSFVTSDVAGLQAEDLFACLDRHRVQYVLIGGLAAVLHGSPLPTLDADICPSTDPENLERLAVPMTIRGVTVRVAALEDVIRSKEAASRPKDQRSLPVLRQLLDEVRRRRGANEHA